MSARDETRGRAAMTADGLAPDELIRLAARAEAADLATPGARAALLGDLDPSVRARLRVLDRPADQLVADLRALNEGGPGWLGVWLRAAERRVAPGDRGWFAALRRALDPDGPTPASDVRPELVRVPAGSFSRGSLPDEPGHFPDEAPLHRVEITRALLMGRTPVTRGQYRRLLGRHPGDGADEAPVTGVGWRDAVRYCNALSAHEGRPPAYEIGPTQVAVDFDGDGYRLPTDAEWEYACRAGTASRYWSGDDETDAHRVGELGRGEGDPGPVGLRAANPWGLCDLHGGVWEWCTDGLARYGPEEPQVDPVGPLDGIERVVRGGSVREPPSMARAACRATRSVGRKGDDMGFRVVRRA